MLTLPNNKALYVGKAEKRQQQTWTKTQTKTRRQANSSGKEETWKYTLENDPQVGRTLLIVILHNLSAKLTSFVQGKLSVEITKCVYFIALINLLF